MDTRQPPGLKQRLAALKSLTWTLPLELLLCSSRPAVLHPCLDATAFSSASGTAHALQLGPRSWRLGAFAPGHPWSLANRGASWSSLDVPRSRVSLGLGACCSPPPRIPDAPFACLEGQLAFRTGLQVLPQHTFSAFLRRSHYSFIPHMHWVNVSICQVRAD